ncbi:MAG: hypothetical protein MEQ07_08985 [Aquimonas sp.]|nr:hypothetical protein [Aquimonas sp.]
MRASALAAAFTGHSLGGGLASSSGTVAGHRFTTFNAAGVHENTITRFTNGDLSNDDAHPLGRRYYTRKDPLTYVQTEAGSENLYSALLTIPGLNEIAWRSAGITGGRLRPALGAEVIELQNLAWQTAEDRQLNRTRDAGWLGGHGSMTVVQGIEAEKEASIHVLQNASRASVYNLHRRGNPALRDADLRWIYEQPVWESW